MLALWERSPRSVKDVACALSLDSATLSPLLKRLEAAGLLTRGRDSADERRLTVELTAQGRALREQALDVPGAVLARLGVEVDDLLALHGSLTRLIAATQAAG